MPAANNTWNRFWNVEGVGVFPRDIVLPTPNQVYEITRDHKRALTGAIYQIFDKDSADTFTSYKFDSPLNKWRLEYGGLLFNKLNEGDKDQIEATFYDVLSENPAYMIFCLRNPTKIGVVKRDRRVVGLYVDSGHGNPINVFDQKQRCQQVVVRE